jgi:hypothetical protein
MRVCSTYTNTRRVNVVEICVMTTRRSSAVTSGPRSSSRRSGRSTGTLPELDLNPTTKAAKHALQDLIMRLGETFAVTESVIHLRLRDLVVFRQSSLQLR